MHIRFQKLPHCSNCVGSKWPDKGFVPASGSGENGVLVVAEACGEHEQIEGMPLVGKAGYYLWQQLKRIDIDREGFKCHNVLSCRPPFNKLSEMSYEEDAISYCSPLLDTTIREMREQHASSGKTFVIVTLGQIAFRRILGLSKKDPLLREDYLCYPIWSEKYGAWIIATDHPSYLMRGYNHKVPVLQFAFKRALEIAESGLKLDDHQYLLDPPPGTLQEWLRGYERALTSDPQGTFLSYDIETPYKQGQSEDALAKEEDGEDYRILRISFAYKPNEAISIPWQASYLPYIEELFKSPGPKVGWNSANYDDPRILQHMEIRGDRLDGMLCWHVLNSALDKALGFVTPFYVPTTGMWKHLSDSQPAFYNAKDADMALRCFLGIRRDLIKNKQWETLDRHVIQLNRVLTYMTGKGVKLDQNGRAAAEGKLQDLLDATELHMEAVVPQEARKIKLLKKAPKDLTGWTESTQDFPVEYCSSCGLQKPKRWKKHLTLCSGRDISSFMEPFPVWVRPLEFKVSKLSLTNYQKAMRHQAIINRKEGKITFDEKAILKLIKNHPQDLLYPRILEHREYQKLLSTYIGITQPDGSIRGGMSTGRDGRIHTLYTHNPSTLRLASQNPNLQNLPRPKGPDDLASIIRNLIMADDGMVFAARDYSGIEAVLVGYFASAPRYIRLAKMDIHSFYTAYALNQLDGRVHSNDLPILSWDDEKLARRLSEIKKEFKHERNNLYKHLIHGGNFKQGPKGAQEKIFLETGIEYPVSLVAKVMSIYFELFPEIPKWHTSLLLQAERDGFIRNPFGYIHRFSKVFDYEKVGNKWERKPGPETNKVIAFLPQSTAAGIIKEALLRLYFERFEEAGQWLRLQVHDEIFSEVPEHLAHQVDAVKKEEMERPILALPLPASYGMGEYLVINTEEKFGKRWGEMR